MDKTTRRVTQKLFLIGELPAPLTRASAHLQLFDNYIADTRLRLRSVRDPETRSWTRVIQQRTLVEPERFDLIEIAEIYLDDAEYGRFEIFEGAEIRKNRYFIDEKGVSYELDVYLWPLWGLNTARVEFEDGKVPEDFEPPSFALREITNDAFFWPANLVGKSMEDVLAETAKHGNG